MSTRRGACPSLREPMLTGDGLLVRLSPAGTGWSPHELLALAGAEARFGNGMLEVTSRGNLQIRGLTTASAEGLAAEIEAAAVPLRSGLPIDTGPLAGIDAHEVADPLPLAQALRDAVDASGLTARLAPKTSIVVDGGGALPLDGVLADIRLVAEDSTSGRWQVAVGGSARSARLVGSVAGASTVPAILALLEAVAAKGSAARGRDLTDSDMAPLLSVPPLLFAAHTAIFRASAGEALKQSRDGMGSDSPSRGRAPVGRFALRDGSIAIAVALPFGQIEAESLMDFCAAVERTGAPEIRLAPGRSLVVPGLGADACGALETGAAALGLITDPADPRLGIAACAGAPACASAHLATRRLGAEIAARAPDLVAGRTLHISGCAKRCAEPAAPGATILGTEGGCLVLPGDGRDAGSAAAVAPEEAIAALRRLADTEPAHEERPARVAEPAAT